MNHCSFCGSRESQYEQVVGDSPGHSYFCEKCWAEYNSSPESKESFKVRVKKSSPEVGEQ